jgi:type IV secretory pathway component VirB8
MERFIEVLKIIVLFFVVAIIVIAFLQTLNEEEPHRVTIEGKQYIRSKEYSGNGTYQVILIPVDSTNTK